MILDAITQHEQIYSITSSRRRTSQPSNAAEPWVEGSRLLRHRMDIGVSTMSRLGHVARGIGVSALMLAASSQAFAEGKADRARQAIAQAQGKIEAAHIVGTGSEVPAIHAEALAALRAAKEDLASGHKERAIAEANRASALADTAVGEAQANRAADDRAAREDAAATAAQAQQDAAAANARAAAAEQAASSAQADAAMARNAPPVMIAPAPTTTVTTQTEKRTAISSTPKRRVVVRSAPRTAAVEKTTTTVTTSQN
ncbi:hypothetical protein [Flavisphingomonas formosensis]|uniref:hypothetical protein n=1 Tax=Flavisphingomonas formosensis TaxID=861534 RepID=UPI002FCD2C30